MMFHMFTAPARAAAGGNPLLTASGATVRPARRRGLWPGLWVAAFLWLAGAAGLPAATYYVATTGNDLWSGRMPEAGNHLDGPFLTLHRAALAMQPGDVTFVRGGFYNCTNYDCQYFDPVADGVTLSNYPHEYPLFANQQGIPELLSVYGRQGVRICGINATNCQRTAGYRAATNCELAYCDLGHSDPWFAINGMVQFVGNSVSNHIHDNYLHDSHHDYVAVPQADKGTPLLLGNSESNPADFTGYNLVERNTLYHGGHDVLQIQSNCNIIRSNWLHNEPWVYWPEYGQLGGHRCLDVEPRAMGNVIEFNEMRYAGQALANPSGNGIEICGASNLVRFNAVLWSQQYGLLLYGNKDGTGATDPRCDGNHVYNNTLAWNCLGQLHLTNLVTAVTKDYDFRKVAVQVNYGTNNVFVNNLLAYNGAVGDPTSVSNRVLFLKCGVADNHWLAQWTNSSNGDPRFERTGTHRVALAHGPASVLDPHSVVVTNNPSEAPFATLDVRLRPDSPCLGTGAYLTWITSPSGIGTVIQVADAAFFSDGYGMVAGDVVELADSRRRARVLRADYEHNRLYLSTRVAWTNGQPLSLSFSGRGPNFGAYGTP